MNNRFFFCWSTREAMKKKTMKAKRKKQRKLLRNQPEVN
jgi:hypothetical protein